MSEDKEQLEQEMDEVPTPLWWVKHIVLALVSGFFLVFGIHVMVAAYGLKNPHNFVMTFFAASFIILIAGALMVGFIYRMWYYHRKSR